MEGGVGAAVPDTDPRISRDPGRPADNKPGSRKIWRRVPGGRFDAQARHFRALDPPRSSSGKLWRQYEALEALGRLWKAVAELWALGELWEGLEELWESSGSPNI